MPEVSLEFPRAFVEFVNPGDADEIFRCDLTWLTSRWTCIFGAGCQGIYASSPDNGCCTLGAHFSGDEDLERVTDAVEMLGPEHWESFGEGHERWSERDPDGELKTRVFEGACIFHNSRGFDGGYGCALHVMALARGLAPHTTKPDVCWQLPLRRQFRDVDRGDGTSYSEVSIGEYTRAGWGPGGADLDWYCSSNTDAHIAAEPVYVSNREELTELMGAPGYAELVRHCEAHLAGPPHAPHGADPR